MRKDEAKSILLKTIPCPYKDNEKICHHLQEGGGDCESCYEEALDTILNLVEKQQKEIEEKTTILLAGAEKVKQLEKEIEEMREELQMYVDVQNNDIHNYISKDKIREKIEEIKTKKIGASTGIYAIQVDVLQELLEENTNE